MTNHTDLINFIASKIKALSYLEIGTNNCRNFEAINIKNKIGVDPDKSSPCANHVTSDEFFKTNKLRFDIIFIDGLHHADQVKKDIINSWNCLNDNGIIVIHDCNPAEEKYTHVPRLTKQWTGDVYKVAASLINDKITVDIDYGCMVVPKMNKGIQFTSEPNWNYFDKNRKDLLKLISVEDFVKMVESTIFV